MDLERLGFAVAHLTALPTPLEEASRFSRVLQGPRILIKRDDTTSLALGGNKARKLELLIGQALSMGCDSVITTGGPQSNHARMTAAAARKFGLEPILVLEGEDPGVWQGNLLLDHILGAELVFTGSRTILEVIEETRDRLARKGRKPYVIPLGGSNPLGSLGYVSCAEEITEETREMSLTPRAIYVATGSSGTLAGLLLGSVLLDSSYEIYGIAVSPGAREKEERARELAFEALELLVSKGARIESGVKEKIQRYPMKTLDGFVGPGYGVPTPECLEAITLLARTEGILTDPVYSGKALSALISHVRDGRYTPSDTIVFVHTGGAPANFAYLQAFVGKST